MGRIPTLSFLFRGRECGHVEPCKPLLERMPRQQSKSAAICEDFPRILDNARGIWWSSRNFIALCCRSCICVFLFCVQLSLFVSALTCWETLPVFVLQSRLWLSVCSPQLSLLLRATNRRRGSSPPGEWDCTVTVKPPFPTFGQKMQIVLFLNNCAIQTNLLSPLYTVKSLKGFPYTRSLAPGIP